MHKRVNTVMTDEQVPRSGIYRVAHRKHPIQNIKLLKDVSFPSLP